MDFITNHDHSSSDNGSQTFVTLFGILLPLLWRNNFVYLLVVFFCIFLMKKEFTCCKFAAFEHFTVYEHPFLLCQHCCCCHIYPAHRSTNSWRLLLLQLYFGTLIFPFQRPNPALSMGLPSKPWVCVSSWNFPPGMLCRMWVTYFGFQEACYCTLKS